MELFHFALRNEPWWGSCTTRKKPSEKERKRRNEKFIGKLTGSTEARHARRRRRATKATRGRWWRWASAHAWRRGRRWWAPTHAWGRWWRRWATKAAWGRRRRGRATTNRGRGWRWGTSTRCRWRSASSSICSSGGCGDLVKDDARVVDLLQRGGQILRLLQLLDLHHIE